MMDLKENDYILGIWFAEDSVGNLMVIVKAAESDVNHTVWEGFWRYREYAANRKIFDSDDYKTGYIVKTNPDIPITEEEMIKKIDGLLENYSLDFDPTILEKVLVKGDVNELLKKTKDKEWFHLRRTPKK